MDAYFEISQTSKRNIDFDCVPFCIEKLLFTQDFVMHTHDFAQLIVVLGGSAKLGTQDRRELLQEGQVCVIPGNLPHSFEEVKNLSFVSILYYTGELLEQSGSLAEHPGFRSLFTPPPGERPQIGRLSLDYEGAQFVGRLLDTVLAELERPLPGYETLVQSYFMILITYLSRAYAGDLHPAVSHPVNLNRTVLYMEKNYRRELTAQELASVSGLSERQLRRLFLRQFGCSPLQYLTDIRLKHACHMLRCTDLSVAQIADKSGFADSNYFSRKFKQYTRLSPQQYRRRERQESI